MSDIPKEFLSAPDRAEIEAMYVRWNRDHSAPRWLCRFGWHQWSIWFVVGFGPIRTSGGACVGNYMAQQRYCLSCHDVRFKEYRT